MSNSTFVVCPLGFVVQPEGLVQEFDLSKARSICIERCCVPCPFQETMFPSYTVRYHVVDILALISLILLFLMLLSYLVIPAASQPNMQKVSVCTALLVLTASRCFTMFQPYAETLCADNVLTATFRDGRCGVQGFLLLFGGHAVCLWASMRAYTLLALITYQRSLTSTRWIIAINTICWGLPIAFAFAAIASQTIGYFFSATCGPRASWQAVFFFIPILLYSIPALFAKLWFLGKFILLYRRAPPILPNPQQINDAIGASATEGNGTAAADDTLEDLSGAHGESRRRSAIRQTLFVNWRNIAQTTALIVLTNFIGITWLTMLRYALGNPYARIAAVSSWYACVIQFGAESSRCQTVALEVIDLPVVWSAEFILTILGILAFILEAVRKSWLLAWWELIVNTYKTSRTAEKSQLSQISWRTARRASKIFTSGYPSKSANTGSTPHLNQDIPMDEMNHTSRTTTSSDNNVQALPTIT